MGGTNDPLELPPPATGQDLSGAIADVEKQFGVMVVKARNSIRKRAAAIHPELQPMGYKVLTILARSGPAQQVALAHEMAADKAVMSRTIKQLEELGLVSRIADPSDGRAMLVDMTADTQRRYDASLSDAHRLLYNRLATWDAGEVRRFADLLGRLNGSMD